MSDYDTPTILADQDAELGALRQQVTDLEVQLAAVRALHAYVEWCGCGQCEDTWPCKTARALGMTR